MPIVILIDVSLSMWRPLEGQTQTRYSAAAAGVGALLDHLSSNSRLEFVSLIVFSSLYEIVCDFTRDYDLIKKKLRAQGNYDKTFIEEALHGAYLHTLSEWGYQTHSHFVLVTDGCVSSISGTKVPVPIPNFPCTLHIMIIASPDERIANTLYRMLIKKANGNNALLPGSLNVPEAPLSTNTVVNMFKKLCTDNLRAWRGLLRCGSLEGHITLAPAPIPYTHVTDFDTITLNMSDELEICGFLSMKDISSPMALRRHLILPIQSTHKADSESSPSSRVKDSNDFDQVPHLCVLLHGALRMEGFAALVQLGTDWFGIVYSWTDSKKKSNLLLSVLPPGDDVVPWLGPLDELGITDTFHHEYNFPVSSSEKRSYTASSAIWLRTPEFQTDLTKLLRYAKKLPQKIHHFSKEINRMRKSALALGWVEALEAVATTLEREAFTLPSAATASIAVAVQYLRDRSDPKQQFRTDNY